MNVRDNWRIVVLVILVVLSGIALFAPTGGAGDAGNATDGAAPPANESDGGQATTSSGLTNLQFGLELSGGTRLRAELRGSTAENVPLGGVDRNALQSTVAEELDLQLIDVRVRFTSQTSGTVEVFAENVTESEFRSALSAAGVDASGVSIRDGVTQATRETAVNTLDQRINQGGLTGGGATLVNTATGDSFVVVEVPNANRTEVLNIIGDPGRVQVVAVFPEQTDNGTVYREDPLLTQGDFRRIGQAQRDRNGVPGVGVVLTDESAPRFQQAMNDHGFTGEGVDSCRARVTSNGTLVNGDNPGYCLYTVQDGDVVYAASMSPTLAGDLRSGDWANDPSFTMQTISLEEAERLKFNLEAGALPTELDIQSQVYLAPSLAQKFKPLALLTGLVAWLTVSGVIYVRYREAKVAIPMLLTAGAEVWILLGFASAVGLALDLSHIAGLIAVIGTGVDDLVIIADEILQRGEIATNRVFKSRFRKAFWVIGAAAATTIIAMLPLAFLSLGDLQGFAIVTIVGVLIGVLITRPAYGDALRNLLLDTD
ncbi:preprotein translocase subunit SecD [Halobacteriales archaeon Cl-PHB]